MSFNHWYKRAQLSIARHSTGTSYVASHICLMGEYDCKSNLYRASTSCN